MIKQAPGDPAEAGDSKPEVGYYPIIGAKLNPDICLTDMADSTTEYHMQAFATYCNLRQRSCL
jgi:hypothetical protein